MKPPADPISPEQLLGRLHWRYATKRFDPTRKIDSALWNALEDALVLSPSSGGTQPWGFVVVTDPAMREQLWAASYQQPQVKDASHLVVFAAKTDFSESDIDAHIAHTAAVRGVTIESLAAYRGMLVGSVIKAKDAAGRQAWAGKQVGIALGVLLSSAALVGVDACPMEGFEPAKYDSILGLTAKGLGSVAICALGYRLPTDPYAALAKVRFSKDRVITHV